MSRRVPAQSPAPGEHADDALVTGLRAGATAAFDLAFETYRARIYSFLLRLTRNTALAGDLNQEVWLRLASHARRLQPDTALGAWLFTVARNLFVSHRRWALLDRERLAALGLLRSHAQVPSPLEAAVGADVHARVERAIGELPAAQREVLLLISVEGFGVEAVAKMLDTREATVRKRLSRARAAIKAALGSNDPSREKP